MASPQYDDGEYTGEVVAPTGTGNLDIGSGQHNWARFLAEFPQYNNKEFEEFVLQHNKADGDSGELDDIPYDELNRLLADFLRAQKAIPDSAGTPTYYLDPNALYTYTALDDPPSQKIVAYGINLFREYLQRGLDNLSAEKKVLNVLQVEFAISFEEALKLMWGYFRYWDNSLNELSERPTEDKMQDMPQYEVDLAPLNLPPWWESRLRNMNRLEGSFKLAEQRPTFLFDEIRDMRVPFYVLPDGTYEIGLPGSEHYEMEERRWLLNHARELGYTGHEGNLQGNMIFHPEYGEQVNWPVNFNDAIGTWEEWPWLTPELKQKITDECRAMWEAYGGGDKSKTADAMQDDQHRNSPLPFERLDLQRWTEPTLERERTEDGDQLCWCDLYPDPHPISTHEDTWSNKIHEHPHMYEEQLEMNTVGNWINPYPENMSFLPNGTKVMLPHNNDPTLYGIIVRTDKKQENYLVHFHWRTYNQDSWVPREFLQPIDFLDQEGEGRFEEPDQNVQLRLTRLGEWSERPKDNLWILPFRTHVIVPATEQTGWVIDYYPDTDEYVVEWEKPYRKEWADAIIPREDLQAIKEIDRPSPGRFAEPEDPNQQLRLTRLADVAQQPMYNQPMYQQPAIVEQAPAPQAQPPAGVNLPTMNLDWAQVKPPPPGEGMELMSYGHSYPQTVPAMAATLQITDAQIMTNDGFVAAWLGVNDGKGNWIQGGIVDLGKFYTHAGMWIYVETGHKGKRASLQYLQQVQPGASVQTQLSQQGHNWFINVNGQNYGPVALNPHGYINAIAAAESYGNTENIWHWAITPSQGHTGKWATLDQHEIEDATVYRTDMHQWTDDNLHRMKEKDNVNEELIPNEIAQWVNDRGEVAFVYMDGKLYWGHNIQDIVAREFTHVPNINKMIMLSGILNVHNETIRLDDSYGYNRDYNLVNSLMNKLKITLELPKLRALDPDPEVEPDDFRSNEEIYQVKDHIMGSTLSHQLAFDYDPQPGTWWHVTWTARLLEIVGRPEEYTFAYRYEGMEQPEIASMQTWRDMVDAGHVWPVPPSNERFPKKNAAIQYVLWVYTSDREYDRYVEEAVGRYSDGSGQGPDGRDMDFWFDSLEEATSAKERVENNSVLQQEGLIATIISPSVKEGDIPDYPEDINWKEAAGYNPSVNSYDDTTWDHSFWWHNPSSYYNVGEAEQIVGKILWKADQFLERNYKRMNVRQFSGYKNNYVFPEILKEWKSLPPNYRVRDISSPFDWDKFPQPGEQIGLDNYPDDNDFYRQMDTVRLQENTDLLWQWNSYWLGRIGDSELERKIQNYKFPDLSKEIWNLQNEFTELFTLIRDETLDDNSTEGQFLLLHLDRGMQWSQRLENILRDSRQSLFDHYFTWTDETRGIKINREFIDRLNVLIAIITDVFNSLKSALIYFTGASRMTRQQIVKESIDKAFEKFQDFQNNIDEFNARNND